jgi:predicted nucleic acid-binding protein
MTAADTSFLFALYGSDVHTPSAQAWAQQARLPITVTILNRFEFGNALRFAAFRRLISKSDAGNSIAAFDADLKQGILQMVPCDFAAVIGEAERLSDMHTLTGGHRSFDILHLATARVLKASTLLTFDLNQKKLAKAVRLPVAPLT